jgi:hypothetical protein
MAEELNDVNEKYDDVTSAMSLKYKARTELKENSKGTQRR